MTVQVGFRVQCPGSAVAAHWHAGHGFDAADHDQVFEAGTDFHRTKVHGFQPRGAEAVDLHACHADIPSGHLGRGFGDVGALIADRRHAAEHHVIDLAGIEGGPLLQGSEQPGDQVHRFDAVQGAVSLAFATGRA
ncbi:hypothetical protein D3C85_1387150 [compost metagenome]